MTQHQNQDMRRPQVLIFSDYYYPAAKAGGPVKTIRGIVTALADTFAFAIVTRGHDLGSPTPFAQIQTDNWREVDGARVIYQSWTFGGVVQSLLSVMRTQYDLVYLNSFFSPRYSILPLVMVKLGIIRTKAVLIAPRGEFGAAALLSKQGRKQLFLKVAGALRLYDRVYWHASTEAERADILKGQRVARHRTYVAPNVLVAPDVTIANDLAASAKSGGREDDVLRVCFVSRIARIKNLHYAIEVLLRSGSKVLFDIYGPIEDQSYWAGCQELLAQAPENVRWRYRGPLATNDVPKSLSEYDMLFVPTLGENFGHIFFESLSVGTAVLVSDQTPWRQLADAGVGWDCPLERPGAFLACIEKAAAEDLNARSMRRKKCLAFAKAYAESSAAVAETKRVFQSSIAGRTSFDVPG